MLSLLFSDTRELLGEVETQQGALSRIILTDLGERVMGAQVQLWQTRGVPTRKEMERVDEDGTIERIFFTDYIQTRDQRFHAVLERWGHEFQMALLEVSPEIIPCWELLVHLPFEPEERFAFLIAILHTPAEERDEWRRCLKEAQVLIEHHRAETRKTIDHLKARMSRLLLHPFTRAHAQSTASATS